MSLPASKRRIAAVCRSVCMVTRLARIDGLLSPVSATVRARRRSAPAAKPALAATARRRSRWGPGVAWAAGPGRRTVPRDHGRFLAAQLVQAGFVATSGGLPTKALRANWSPSSVYLNQAVS